MTSAKPTFNLRSKSENDFNLQIFNPLKYFFSCVKMKSGSTYFRIDDPQLYSKITSTLIL